MAPIYRILTLELGPAGMLAAFSDDVYLHGPPYQGCPCYLGSSTPLHEGETPDWLGSQELGARTTYSHLCGFVATFHAAQMKRFFRTLSKAWRYV
jgi:hypothetical protein